HVPTSGTCFTSPRPFRIAELKIAEHLTSPPAAQPSRGLEQPPKPRSRRCFVCGTTGMHPLNFRFCPRTAVLLRRSLAKIDDHGRLVSIDGSPLPMTRHPGGVAAHLISRSRNPTRFLPKTPKVSPAPPDLTSSLPPPFDSSSPHTISPVDVVSPAPEHVPFRRTIPSDDQRARALFPIVLLESLLDATFRIQ
ncbi:hypothetical protein GGX14DRAFT_600762, partial [Mycena pura]